MQVDDFERRYPQGLLCDLDDVPEGCGVVYMITNPINDKVYVGQTWVGVRRRWEQHLEAARNGRQYYISKAIRKHGSESFTVGVLAWADTQAKLDSLESLWILVMGSTNPAFGYNSKHGGSTGRLTPTTIKRISQATHQRWEVSEDRRTQLSETMTQRWADPEFRRKTTEGMRSPETLEKVTAKRKIRYSDPAVRQKISETVTQRYTDPEERRKSSDAQRKRWQTPGEKEKRSEINRRLWSDPEFKVRQSAAIRRGWAEKKARKAK